MEILPRRLESEVIASLRSNAVTVLEGPRSVGKTVLLRHMLQRGDIARMVSLTDRQQLAAAQLDTAAWLDSFPQPLAIDEAQLLPELPLAIKTRLDQNMDSDRFLLSGSASLARQTMGGADPLARRTHRMRLLPLTMAELHKPGTSWSLIDALFEDAPSTTTGPLHFTAARELHRALAFGGMPTLRLPAAPASTSPLRRTVLHHITDVLGDTVLPDDPFDRERARQILDRFLRSPAGELRVGQAAKDLDMDPRTINRYLDVLERLMLVYEIPNLVQPAKKSLRSAARLMPVDTAYSYASLGNAAQHSDQARGGLFEAFVAQQLSASLAWSSVPADLFHWRHARGERTREVDLVLQDADGRLVGIEVKSAAQARPDHFKGLRALADEHPDRFHRGFVITTGGTATAFGQDMWALPWTALRDPDAWHGPTPSSNTPTTPMGGSMPANSAPETRVFFSYAHKDQERITGGNPRQFVLDVRETLEDHFERPVKLWMDVKDGRWGEDLWARLEEEVQRSTYMIALITPSYLRSESCRTEFTRFLDAAETRGAGASQLLPLLWIEPRAMREDSADAVAARIKSTRYEDVTAAAQADRSSGEYRALVMQVAEALDEVLEEAEKRADIAPEQSGTEGTQEREGLFEVAARLQNESFPALERALEEVEQAATAWGDQFAAAGAFLETTGGIPQQRTLQSVARKMAAPNAKLTGAVRNLSALWENVLGDTRAVMSVPGVADPEERKQLARDIRAVAADLEDIDLALFDQMSATLPEMSIHLVPTGRAAGEVAHALREMVRHARDMSVD